MHSLLLLLCTFTQLIVVLSFSASPTPLPDLSLVCSDYHEQSAPILLPSEADPDKTTIEFELHATKFIYLIDVEVGGLKKKAVPDTGSDPIWLHGTTCNQKLDKDGADCILSDIAGGVCSLVECQVAEAMSSIAREQCDNKHCKFEIKYADQASTSGDFIRGHIKFHEHGESEQQKEVLPPRKIWFGVASGTKENHGVVGLGPGRISLITQLKRQGVKPKFSYSLPHPSSTSPNKLIIGEQVSIPKDTHTIKLNSPKKCNCQYCTNLKSISVNNKPLSVSETKLLLIDSGATFTSLHTALFNDFKALVKKELEAGDPKSLCNDKYPHCFKLHDTEKLKNIKASFGLAGDGNLELQLEHYNFLDYVESQGKDNKDIHACLTVKDGKDITKLGSRAQIDFKVTFDRRDNKDIYVSFEPAPDRGKDHKLEKPVITC